MVNTKAAQRVRFVVWGAGGRGKIAAEIFGEDRIVAFIDGDPDKIGTNFCNRPIIDFDQYKKEYSMYAILVSPAIGDTIAEALRREDLFFFYYNECPPELIGYGWQKAKKYRDKVSMPSAKSAIYGDSLYSVLLYEYLTAAGYECVGLIHNKDLSENAKKSFAGMFPHITVKQLCEIGEDTEILQTVSDCECSQELFSKKSQNIYDWKDCIKEYYNPKIANLQNKYEKRRCFIVATGPSLTLADLDVLNRNHEFCMSVNTIFYSFDQTKWRPDQYIVVDLAIIEHYADSIKEMDVREKFIPDACIDFDYESLSDEFYVYHSIYTAGALRQGLITENFAKYAYNTGTVTAVCLQLAMYEGFEEIYLLGCDCSYFETGLKHFCEPEELQINGYGVLEGGLEILAYHINAYEKIRDYADKKGIKIFNATRGGYLETFERVNFDDLF